MRRKVLVVFETPWDRAQLEACRPAWERDYEIEFARPSDEACSWDLDVLGLLAEETARRRGPHARDARIDGVLSTSDYPGATFAAALATALGLPGPTPQAVLRASQKHASRLVQRQVAPEAVPPFSLLDPDDPSTWDPEPGFPCFVKPVKGAFSILSGVMTSREELGAFLRSPRVASYRTEFLAIFNRLAAHYELEHDGRYFLAEGLLQGLQVTVEGWRTRSASGTLGVVDSIFRPGTRSFEAFEYPSRLPAEVQARLVDVAQRVAGALGLVDTLFNVELTWDPATDRIGILEVNPRGCGQFADLYAKVDGTSGTEVALALATGAPPPGPRPDRARRAGPAGGPGSFAAAASFPLRVYEPARAVHAPDAERVRAVQARHPATLVHVECRSGELLTDFGELEDGHSHRYAVVNLGAADRAGLRPRLEEVRAELGFVLEPLGDAAAGRPPALASPRDGPIVP